VKWAHCGCLKAKTSCEFIKIDGDVVAQNLVDTNTTLQQLLRKFAILATAHAEDMYNRVTDLPLDHEMVEEMLVRAHKFMRLTALTQDNKNNAFVESQAVEWMRSITPGSS